MDPYDYMSSQCKKKLEEIAINAWNIMQACCTSKQKNKLEKVELIIKEAKKERKKGQKFQELRLV